MNIESILSDIINPNSKKSLGEENRLIRCEDIDGSLFITYKRDGITPEDKRVIENSILNAYSGNYSEDKIQVMTVSDDSSDVGRAKCSGAAKPNEEAPKQQASLNVGHGQVGNKRRVPNVKKVIAVSSCKGGVGKSTVAVNLAISLKNQGKSVGILDADIYGPSLPTLLNQKEAKPEANENKKILPIQTNGISFISFGLFIPESDPVIWRGPMLGGVLNQFLFDVDWGELDYLVIDLPPGTGDMQLSLIQNCELDGVLVVSTPQAVALLDTKKGLNMFKQVNTPVLGMIENMSYFAPDDSDKKYFIFGEAGVEKISKELDVPFLGGIPLEIALRESADNGTPYMNNPSYEGRAVWNSYMEISKEIDTIVNGKAKKGFFGKLLNK